MTFLGEDMKFWLAIILTSVMKIFMTPDPPDDEKSKTPKAKWKAIKKGIGGIIAGFVCAYYGYDRVIHWSGFFDENDKIIVVVALTITGEHIMRWIMGITPDNITDIIMSKIKK